MAIPQEFIDELLNRVDIVEVIGERVPLKSRGNRHLACCPFHNEKTPSFTVDANKQFFYCFGCRASGTAINFLMRKDGLDFVSAIRQLAARVGMEVPDSRQQDPGKQRRFHHLADILDAAAQYYRQCLKENHKASQYLEQRNISPEIASQLRIGYAPPGWDTLQKQFGQRFSISDLLAVGLLKHSQNSQHEYYDAFRDRLMFPIRNVRGQTVGFGGRALDKNNPAKYINTAATDLFHKKSEIYGLYELTSTKPTDGRSGIEEIYLVEGYMDVVAMKCHGLGNAVACMGTAVNQIQLQKILKRCKQLILCFDGDNAGQEAAWRAVVEVLSVLDDGDSLSLLFLPTGEDPDSYLQNHSSDEWLKYRSDQEMQIDQFLFRRLSNDRDFTRLSDRAAFARQVVALCKSMRSSVYRHLLQDSLSEQAGIDKASLADLIASNSANASRYQSRIQNASRRSATRIVRTKWDELLSMLMSFPGFIDEIGDDADLLYLDKRRQEVQGNCPNDCLKTLILCQQTYACANARQLLNTLDRLGHTDVAENSQTAWRTDCIDRLRQLAMMPELGGSAEQMLPADSNDDAQSGAEAKKILTRLIEGLRQDAKRKRTREDLNRHLRDKNPDEIDQEAEDRLRSLYKKTAKASQLSSDSDEKSSETATQASADEQQLGTG